MLSAAAPALTADDPQFGTSAMHSVIILGLAVVVLIAGRFLIARTLHLVAESPRIFRLMGLSYASDTERRRERERRERRLKSVSSLLRNALTVVVVLVAFIMLLDTWGLPVGPLVTSVGIVGVAIGFGAQQLIRDYLAGIFLIVEDQFGIGDLIETSEVVGRVRAMSLRTTTVEASDGAIWYLRNGEIMRVANRSQGTHTGALPLTEPQQQDAKPYEKGYDPTASAAQRPTPSGPSPAGPVAGVIAASEAAAASHQKETP